MMRVLVWKEVREQWTAAVALVVLGVGLLVGLHFGTDDPPAKGGDLAMDSAHGAVLPLILVWMCGLIVGAQPFAVERENGTMSWLDALPINRRRIWLGKALAAITVFILQIGLLVGLAAWLGYLYLPGNQPVVILFLFLVTGIFGLTCGLFGSAIGRTSLGAFAWALVAQIAAIPVLFLAHAIIAACAGLSHVPDNVSALLFVTFPALTLDLSFRRFTRLDRQRRKAKRLGPVEPTPRRVLLWLAWRQVRWLHVPIVVVGLLTAAILLPTMALAWPFFGLVFGAMLGVSAFAPDNLGGSVRFLGERRLPLGRVWFVKTAVAAMPLVGVIALLMLFALPTFFTRSHGVSNGIQGTPTDAACMILLGPVYGFAVGQFFGLVSRKGAVAAVLTLLVGSSLFAVWLPSMIVGGLAPWQVFGPPLVLIATTRLAMRPWVAGRLSDWRPAMGIAGAALLAIGSVAFGIWWRVVQVPAVGPPFDVKAFVASAPTPEQNVGGRRMRAAAMAFAKLWNELIFQEIDAPPDPNSTPARFYHEAVDGLNQSGWPVGRANLDSWMDRVFAAEWFPALREAVALPPGITSSPWPPAFGYADDLDVVFQRMNILLCARALQFQALNQQADALAMYRLALDLSRHIRPRATAHQFLEASRMEMTVMRLLPKWAASSVDQPELLRQAVKMLQEGEAAIPPLTETVETEYAVTRENLILPGRAALDWGSQFFYESVELARLTPWERDRLNRIADLIFAGWMRTAALDYKTAIERRDPTWKTADPYPLLQTWLPAAVGPEGKREREALEPFVSLVPQLYVCPFMNPLFADAPHVHTLWRAARLQIALLLYEHENGKPAERLDDLVPAILPEMPADPFGDGPFHYRISKGERINMNPDAPNGPDYATVESGSGVLWSVSSNTVDDGGVKNGGFFLGFGRGPPGLDLIFIVPRPAKK